MANLFSSAMVGPADSEQDRKRMMISPQASPLQVSDSSNGPVAILWDIENCPVPSDVRSENIAGNIRLALRVHPVTKGVVTQFSAYGDFNAFPRRVREGCQRTGVKLIDVPNGRKDAADKAILVDMFLFALDNPPPSTIVLISGDVDFAPALHILGQRGYTVILVFPSKAIVSPALSNAGRFVWDWLSLARGECLEPEKIRSHSLPSGMNCEHNDLWVQPGDINGLQGQLVKLLELSGGCLPISLLREEYKKLYERPLCVSGYGTFKLKNILKKMADEIAVEWKDNRRFVCLLKARSGPDYSPLIPKKRKKTGKASHNESFDTMGKPGSSDESSDRERVVVVEERKESYDACESLVINQNLEKFKHELQEILVSYSCQISVGCFEDVYQQRHKRPLEYKSLGVNVLEELLEKVNDIVMLQEKPGTRKKFIVAVGG